MTQCVRIASHYLTDTIDIYSYTTTVNGHVKASREALHENVPCYVYTQSRALSNAIFGMSNIGVYKIILPLEFNGIEIVIYENYILKWTRQSKVLDLQISSVEIKTGYIECEAQEINP